MGLRDIYRLVRWDEEKGSGVTLFEEQNRNSTDEWGEDCSQDKIKMSRSILGHT